MPFLRQLYKQKPQACGPVSSVQASIFKNAERIGIDPGSIALCMPMWGPGDQIDYAQLYSGANSGATYTKNSLYFDGSNDYVKTPRIFPERKATIFIPSFSFQTAGQFNRIFHSCINTANSNLYGIYVQLTNSNTCEIGYANGGIAAVISRKSFTASNPLQAKTQYGIVIVVRDAIADMSIIIDDVDQAGSYSGGASSYDPGTTTGGVGALEYGGTLYFGHVLMDSIFCFNANLTDSQIAHLSDNPYFLLHRVQPVFYSVPGGAITIKTITDTGSCLDEIAQISNIFVLSDTGTCLDGFSGLIAGISVVDAGSGVDTVKPIASLTVQDTGSAIDLIQQISAACSVEDTGTGTDSIGQILASLVVSDAGAGADVITVLKELLKTVTDSGTGTDSISRILASLSVSDTGSSTDTISQIMAGVSVSDAGSGADFINLLKDILKTISDTGSGTDYVSIQPVFVSVQDVGTALDIIGHIAVALSVSDAGTIAEIISTIKTKMVTVTDTGTGSDSAPTISVSLTVSDTAAALDLVGQVINSLTVSDTGTGLESITKTDFDLLPSGKVTVTFTIKTPGASFAMRTPKATFNIE